MTTGDGAATGAGVAAARSLLTSQSDDLLLVELSAWVLGAAGHPLPDVAEPGYAPHAQLAYAVGSADPAQVVALLDRFLPQPVGSDLLASACELAGLRWPEALVEVAHRHPQSRFVGRMLAATTEPSRLLALLLDDGAGSATIETVGELVIAGRDRGHPVEAAEARWTEVAAEHPTYLSAYRDLLLRITARESLDAAVALLVELGEEWGRDRIVDGAPAVLARLVRSAPGRAAELVGSANDPRDRVAWLGGLAWWLELSPPAHPIVSELLSHGDPDLDLAVARILTGTPELGLLNQALRTAAEHDPITLAQSLAPGVHLLRSGGRLELASRVRLRCLDALAPAARDTFEVIASLGPELVPWAAPFGAP